MKLDTIFIIQQKFFSDTNADKGLWIHHPALDARTLRDARANKKLLVARLGGEHEVRIVRMAREVVR